MAIHALKDYKFESLDSQDKFPPGTQLLYAGWLEHLMFCAPFAYCLPVDTKFGDFVRGPLAESIAAHPDAAKVDWDKAEWTKDNEPFTPDFDKSFKENGLVHKDLLRFRTPGLNGYKGTGN